MYDIKNFEKAMFFPERLSSETSYCQAIWMELWAQYALEIECSYTGIRYGWLMDIYEEEGSNQ